MNEKRYVLTEEQKNELADFVRTEMGKRNVGRAQAILHDLATLPAASAPVVPSKREVGERVKKWLNGRTKGFAHYDMTKFVCDLIGDTFASHLLAHRHPEQTTPSPSDPLREVVATVIMDSAGGDYSADYKDIEIHHDVLDRLPVATKLYAAPEPRHD